MRTCHETKAPRKKKSLSPQFELYPVDSCSLTFVEHWSRKENISSLDKLSGEPELRPKKKLVEKCLDGLPSNGYPCWRVSLERLEVTTRAVTAVAAKRKRSSKRVIARILALGDNCTSGCSWVMDANDTPKPGLVRESVTAANDGMPGDKHHALFFFHSIGPHCEPLETYWTLWVAGCIFE